MNKTLLLLSATLLVGGATPVSAQAWLKSLSEKAVERAVTNVQNRMGEKKQSSSSTTDTQQEQSEAPENYGASLFSSAEYDFEVEVAGASAFANLTKAMQAVPAMPTAAVLLSEEQRAKFLSNTFAPFAQSVKKTMVERVKPVDLGMAMVPNEAQRKQMKEARKAMNQQQKAGLVPTQQEIMQALSEAKVDLSKASETQISDAIAETFSKKWNISKAEYLKIIEMANSQPDKVGAYLRTNHPTLYQRFYAANAGIDPKLVKNETSVSERSAVLFGEVTEILQQLTSVGADYRNDMGRMQRAQQMSERHTSDYGMTGDALSLLSEQLYNEWVASPECKQVNEIEAALQKRLDAWAKTLGTNGKDEVAYPAWFGVERKKENALIAQWNSRMATRWLSAVVTQQQKLKALFDKAAALEAENETLKSKDAAQYGRNLQVILPLYGQLTLLLAPYQDALLCPFLSPVEETGTVSLGKG